MSLIVKGGIKTGPRRCVLYGTAGIGKTTWACSAPAPILIPVEDNGGVVTCDSFPRPSQFLQVLEFMREAWKDDAYKTVVVDSLDWLERLIHEQVCHDEGVDSVEKCGYGKGYMYALNKWREFLRACDKLRDKGKTIVLVAHSQIARYEAPGSDAYDRFTPRLHKSAAALVGEWCDELLFASYEVFITKDKGQLKARAAGDGTRLIHTVETPAWLAKNRLRLAEDLPMDFRAYMAKWPVSPKAEEVEQ